MATHARAHDVRLHIAGTNEPKSAQKAKYKFSQIYLNLYDYFKENLWMAASKYTIYNKS